jgi:urease accessory protein
LRQWRTDDRQRAVKTVVSLSAFADRRPIVRAEGGIAVRETGPGVLHLVSAAATPLGGDVIEIAIDVADGAELAVYSVAAMIALPGRDESRSSTVWNIRLGEDARLVLDPLPTVVAEGADHDSTVNAELAATASLRVTERIQVGRTGESGGSWSGRMRIDVAGTPLLRHRVDLGGPGDRLSDARAMTSELCFPDDRPSDVGDDFVRMALARGGTLSCRLADTLKP